MLTALKEYAVFSGRARRKEYWSFWLIGFLLWVLWGIANLVIDDITVGIGTIGSIINLVFLIIHLCFFIIYIGFLILCMAVSVRRLHDLDRSGWWVLLSFVPLLGLILLIFFCLDGTAGPNRFGEDPKAEERE